MNNVESTIFALKVTRPSDRIWLLEKASKRVSTINLGSFCAKVGASPEELGQLLLNRAKATS